MTTAGGEKPMPFGGPLSDRQLGMIVDRLTELGATQPCPRCSNDTFSLAPGLAVIVLQGDYTTIALGGASMPAVIATCNRCGFVSQHALGNLGLLDNPEFNGLKADAESGDSDAQ